jgi:hypothetical protein
MVGWGSQITATLRSQPVSVNPRTRLRTTAASAGRTYVQPSEPIRASQFDITNPHGIREAYQLGRKDGASFVATL